MIIETTLFLLAIITFFLHNYSPSPSFIGHLKPHKEALSHFADIVSLSSFDSASYGSREQKFKFQVQVHCSTIANCTAMPAASKSYNYASN